MISNIEVGSVRLSDEAKNILLDLLKISEEGEREKVNKLVDNMVQSSVLKMIASGQPTNSLGLNYGFITEQFIIKIA